MTLKWLRVNTTKTTNKLKGRYLIGLANEGKRARFLEDFGWFREHAKQSERVAKGKVTFPFGVTRFSALS